MQCTTAPCKKQGTDFVAFPLTNGAIFVGIYCSEHAQDVLVDLHDSRPAVGPIVDAIDTTQVRS